MGELLPSRYILWPRICVFSMEFDFFTLSNEINKSIRGCSTIAVWKMSALSESKKFEYNKVVYILDIEIILSFVTHSPSYKSCSFQVLFLLLSRTIQQSVATNWNCSKMKQRQTNTAKKWLLHWSRGRSEPVNLKPFACASLNLQFLSPLSKALLKLINYILDSVSVLFHIN